MTRRSPASCGQPQTATTQAWDALVSRYVALLWSIAFRHGLGESDAADVVQNTWLRLFEHIHDVREPARVGSWLATTAQRESLRIVAQRKRVMPSDDEATFDGADRLQAPLDEALLAREQAAEARAALDDPAADMAVAGRGSHPGPAAVVRARSAPISACRSAASARPAAGACAGCGRS